MPQARDDDAGSEAQLLVELGSSVRIDRTSTAERVADVLRDLIAVEYSAQAPREAVEALLELVEAAEHAVADEDWKEVATLNIVFHQRLVELIGSERINNFFRVIDA